MKRQHRTLTDFLTYGASTTVSMDLPRDGVITEIEFDVRTTASKAFVGVCEDAFGRLLNVLSVVGPGESSYFGVTDGRMLHWLSQFTNQQIALDDITGTGEVHAIYRVHFGNFPYKADGTPNHYDMSAGIPANTTDKGQIASLKLRWTCPANTVFDCGTSPSTVSTAYIYTTVYEVLNSPSPQFEPHMEEVDWPVDSTHSALGKKWNVPTGYYIRRLLMLVNDETSLAAGTGSGSVRKDDEVTRIAFLIPQEGGRAVFTLDQWEAKLSGAMPSRIYYGDTFCIYTGVSAAATTTATGKIGVPAGIYNIDFRHYADTSINPLGEVAGLNQIGKQPGNMELAATIGTYADGDDVHLLWDELLPLR